MKKRLKWISNEFQGKYKNQWKINNLHLEYKENVQRDLTTRF